MPVVASAHPLGNFTVNRYSKLTVGAQRLQILYVLDMAEIPAHAERAQIDVDGDGKLSTAEVDRYRTAAAAALLQGVALTVDGTVTPLELQTARLSFPSRPGGPADAAPGTDRAHRSAAVPASTTSATSTAITPTGSAGRKSSPVQGRAPPWRALRCRQQDRSQELTTYPQDLLNDPPRVSEAAFAWQAGTGGGVAEEGDGSPSCLPQHLGRWQPVPRRPPADGPRIRLPTWLPSLNSGSALCCSHWRQPLGWGAMHAMSPGHGKTLVAAYLVGAHGTARHALFLGLTTTITHTAGVFALGFVTLALSRYVLPEQLYPWLSAASGVLVVVIGLSLARRRLFGDAHHHAEEHAPRSCARP